MRERRAAAEMLMQRGFTDEELYCVCQRGNEGFMLCCDYCTEWYHGTCVDVAQTNLDKAVYQCFRCCGSSNPKDGRIFLDGKGAPAKRHVLALRRAAEQKERELARQQADEEREMALRAQAEEDAKVPARVESHREKVRRRLWFLLMPTKLQRDWRAWHKAGGTDANPVNEKQSAFLQERATAIESELFNQHGFRPQVWPPAKALLSGDLQDDKAGTLGSDAELPPSCRQCVYLAAAHDTCRVLRADPTCSMRVRKKKLSPRDLLSVPWSQAKSKRKQQQRTKAKQVLEQALTGDEPDPSGKCRRIAAQIEIAVFATLKATDRHYTNKIRQLKFDISQNEEVRARVLRKELTPKKLATMSSAELASSEIRQKRKAAESEKIRAATLTHSLAETKMMESATGPQLPQQKSVESLEEPSLDVTAAARLASLNRADSDSDDDEPLVEKKPTAPKSVSAFAFDATGTAESDSSGSSVSAGYTFKMKDDRPKRSSLKRRGSSVSGGRTVQFNDFNKVHEIEARETPAKRRRVSLVDEGKALRGLSLTLRDDDEDNDNDASGDLWSGAVADVPRTPGVEAGRFALRMNFVASSIGRPVSRALFSHLGLLSDTLPVKGRTSTAEMWRFMHLERLRSVLLSVQCDAPEWSAVASYLTGYKGGRTLLIQGLKRHVSLMLCPAGLLHSDELCRDASRWQSLYNCVPPGHELHPSDAPFFAVLLLPEDLLRQCSLETAAPAVTTSAMETPTEPSARPAPAKEEAPSRPAQAQSDDFGAQLDALSAFF